MSGSLTRKIWVGGWVFFISGPHNTVTFLEKSTFSCLIWSQNIWFLKKVPNRNISFVRIFCFEVLKLSNMYLMKTCLLVNKLYFLVKLAIKTYPVGPQWIGSNLKIDQEGPERSNLIVLVGYRRYNIDSWSLHLLDCSEIALFSQFGPLKEPGQPPVDLKCVTSRIKIIL